MMPKTPRETIRYTVNVIEFVAPPVGPIEITGQSNRVIDPDSLDDEEHKLPRLVGEEAGRKRFLLTVDMVEERWVDEGLGKRGASRLESRTTVYRSVWLEIGEAWMARIESGWRLFEHADGEEARLMRERLRAGWHLVQLMMATEAYRFWRLRHLFAIRPHDQELSMRAHEQGHLPPDTESDPDDIRCVDRMVTDLRGQVESVLAGGPW